MRNLFLLICIIILSACIKSKYNDDTNVRKSPMEQKISSICDGTNVSIEKNNGNLFVTVYLRYQIDDNDTYIKFRVNTERGYVETISKSGLFDDRVNAFSFIEYPMAGDKTFYMTEDNMLEIIRKHYRYTDDYIMKLYNDQ